MIKARFIYPSVARRGPPIVWRARMRVKHSSSSFRGCGLVDADLVESKDMFEKSFRTLP